MLNEQTSYYAFISYNSADEKWAKWLQHNLEYYHIPSALCKEYPELPKKIRPVFWYKQDLSGTKLKKALNNELSSSKYLIVICSPDSAKSDWVNDEVVAFIRQGKGDKIIPFIVSGTPHAKNPEEECFPPALRNLTRDEEIRGIDVRRKEGKYHALVDVIATMFGVRFDALWQRHERRRKKIRNIWIAAISILLLLALGIFDYTRTKVEYYADFVDRWGIAEGIIPLDEDQVSHRHHSYKFEYTRVPFGEKAFYSWRLKRVSLVNSKGVISDYIPDHHVFFYPIQEFEYTNGYVTNIINRDTYKRVVMQYSVKDDYEYNAACLIDMEGKEKRQGSAYLDASTTSMIPDVNSNSTKSKIKRFHYTRNEDGYVTKVTYHANDGDDLAETAIGDNNNIYGKLFELDSLGRIATLSYINNEGHLMTDKFGVGSIKYTYDSLGETASTIYLDNNKQLTNNEQKFAIISTKFDKYGNSIEQWYEGADGRPCFDYKNRHSIVIKYDSMGCMIEYKFYDINGNLCYCSDNFAIQRAEYDLKGRPIKVMHYDIDDKPCYIKNNFSEFRAKYNSNDCVVEYSFYGINNLPCTETEYGVHKIQCNVNEYNYVVENAFYDTDNNAIISPFYGFHRIVNEYDVYHRIVSVKYLDCDGKPSVNTKDYASKSVLSYDHRGNLIKIENFDIEDKQCVCKSGYASIVYKYDNFGNLVSEAYYDMDGEPIYINMCSSIQYDYYPNGRVKECRYYDENQNLTLNNDWYAIVRFKYDNNGNRIETSFYDVDSNPCYYKNGLYHRVEAEYDIKGNTIRETFWDINNHLTINEKGMYAVARYEYDDHRNIVNYAYYDMQDKPCFVKDGFHIMRVQYDERGNICHQSYYDAKKNPCSNVNGASVIVTSHDLRGNITQIDYKNANGKNVNLNVYNYSIEKRDYDEQNRLICTSFLNQDGNPCWKNTTTVEYCIIKQTYDSHNNVIRYEYLDTKGNLTNRSGVAIVLKKYDEHNRPVEQKYYNKEKHLISGHPYNYNKAIELLDYDDNNRLKVLTLLNADSTLYVQRYYLYDNNGNVLSVEHRDASGSLILVEDREISLVPYAKLRFEWDNRGNILSRSYYDVDDRLANNDDGFAIERFTYNEYGKLVLDELFDLNGKPTNSIVQKWHKSTAQYDERGLCTEISYYDNNNKYVNASTYNANGICKVEWVYDKSGKVIDSKGYIEDNGNAKLQVLDSSPSVERKTSGSLVVGQVLMPGIFQDKGYNGTYFIVVFNEWCLYDDLGKYAEILTTSSDKDRHFIMVPWEEDNGNFRLGKLIDITFPAGTLGVRFVDVSDNNDIFNALVDIYEDYKKQKGE